VTTTALKASEAVDLAHALVASVAETLDVRVLFIKGPSLAWWGLRPPRTSADADALVDPARLPALVAALQQLGWHERPTWFPTAASRRHSVTLIHSQWPCDVDLHSFYPGIFVDAVVAFDAMWSTRARMPIAGVEVDVPSQAVSACILALHALRAPASDRTASELPALVTAIRERFSPTQIAAIEQAATILRCRETLAPFLRDIGASVVDDLTEQERRTWELRINADPTTAWIVTLREAPWTDRPRLLWTALTFVDSTDPSRGEPRTWTRARYRMRRLGRGARAFTSAVRRVRVHGRRAAR
jgi:hypothetical protein